MTRPSSVLGQITRRRALVGLVALLIVMGPGMIGGVRAETPAFQVVVNSANPLTSASRDLLTELFLKKKVEWPNGTTARPADLKADSPVRRDFSEHVLRRSVAAVKNYWQHMIFSGRGVPPPELESDHAVIEYVGRHPGAVGYVSGSAALGRVKALAVH